MEWFELTVDTSSQGIDAVAGALTAGGFPEFIIEDQLDFERTMEETRDYWDYIDEALQEKMRGVSRIKLYLEQADTAGLEKLRALLVRLKDSDRDHSFGTLELTVAPLAETNWEESWKDSYPVQDVGRRFTVAPYWLADQVPEDRLSVVLDPGLIFGTGAHPSTRMVLQQMEDRVAPGSACLDLGSGSGILSIAALRLGARKAVGVDIDPKAEDIARENASYNGFFAPEFTALTGNVTTDHALMGQLQGEHWDVVLVNIVADVIIGLSPVLPGLMDEHSTLICSGILDVRLPDVLQALQAVGLEVTGEYAEEDWRCVCAKRRNP